MSVRKMVTQTCRKREDNGARSGQMGIVDKKKSMLVLSSHLSLVLLGF
jgi:hypothetical protein